MSSERKKQQEKIDHLFIHGNFDQAIEIIDNLLKEKDLEKTVQLAFLIQKSEILLYHGKFEDSQKLTEKVLKESKKQNNQLIQLDAIILKGLAYTWLAEFHKLKGEIEKGEEIIGKLDSLPTKVYAKRKSYLHFLSCYYFSAIFDFKNAEEFGKKCFEFAEIADNKFLLSFFLAYISAIYEKLDNYQKVKELSEKSLSLANELGNKTAIAIALWASAREPFMKDRDFRKARDLLEQALNIAEELKNSFFIGFFSHDLAVIYAFLFDYENALKYYLKALILLNPIMKLFVHNNIHHLYRRLGKNDLAIEHMEKRLKLSQEMNHIKGLSGSLLNLVIVLTDLKNLDKAKSYLELLEQLVGQHPEDRSIFLTYQYAKSYFLKSSDRMKDWINALEIFEELLKEDKENISKFNRLSILLYTSELLYKELQTTGNEDLLKEIKQNIEEVLSLAKKEHFVFLELNALNLKAQIALVELKPEKAKEILSQAIEIAKEKKQEAKEEELIEELKQLEVQFDFWMKLSEKKQPLTESVKHVSLGNAIRKMTQTTDIEVRDEKSGEVIEYRRLFEISI